MANCRFISLPYYNPIVEIHRGREKHARSAAEPGLPLAPLNFRLCLCGSGELLQVCSRPAGSLCHQWKWFFAPRLKRSVGVPFVLPFRATIWSQVASDSRRSPNRQQRPRDGEDKGRVWKREEQPVDAFKTSPPPQPPSYILLKQKWPPLKSFGDTGNAVMPVS